MNISEDSGNVVVEGRTEVAKQRIELGIYAMVVPISEIAQVSWVELGTDNICHVLNRLQTSFSGICIIKRSHVT